MERRKPQSAVVIRPHAYSKFLMAWPVPRFSKAQVNKAGQLLRAKTDDPEESEWALDILNNWRSCHARPMNTFQSTLRDKVALVNKGGLVAQRLKRTPSILGKLTRFKTMNLTQMQDIGGLRAIVDSIAEVRELEARYRASKFQHELLATDDYITRPKSSGYRSLHLIYRYKNDGAPQYNGLLLELQFRSRLQHAWATAVETLGTFLDHALKSSEGPDEWLEFFSLTSAGFALLEKSNPVPNFEKLTDKETFQKITDEAERLNVRGRLHAFSIAANSITSNVEKRRTGYHLIVLDLAHKKVSVQSFGRDDLQTATSAYIATEARIVLGEDLQAVLVSAGPFDSLRKAYPNYFLDTQEFLKVLDRIQKKTT